MIETLIKNPLAQWGLGQARRDKRSLVITIVFLVIFYGIAALIFMGWVASPWRRFKGLCDGLGGLTGLAVGVMLLLWAPARVATTIAKQREDGVLDMLRMTGMSGPQLAAGHLLTQLSLPLTLSLLTLPLAFMAFFSDAGPVGTIRLALAFILLTPVYSMIAALAGLTVNKPQTAGGVGMMAAVGLLILSGVGIGIGQELRELRILALLGPWGQTVAWDHQSYFLLHTLGEALPGDLLQIVFLVILSSALLRALAVRYTVAGSVFFGRQGALLVLFAFCALSLFAWYPDPDPVTTHRWRSRDYFDMAPSLAFHLLVPFFALAWAAIETPLGATAFVRGLARRDADDTLLIEERFEFWRYAGPPIVYGVMTILLLIPYAIAKSEPAAPLVNFEVDAAGILLAGAIAVAAYAFLVLGVQWMVFATRGIGVPRLLGGLVVLGIWVLPVIAGAILDEVGAPEEVQALAYGVNPVFGIVAAAHSADPQELVGFQSSAIGLYCLAIQLFGAIGVFVSLRAHTERLIDHANSLVVLPADAYAAPGTLTQRCEEGHLYTDAWASCPHCSPKAARREADASSEDELELDAIAAPSGQERREAAVSEAETQRVVTGRNDQTIPVARGRGASTEAVEASARDEPSSAIGAGGESERRLDPLQAAIQRSSLGASRRRSSPADDAGDDDLSDDDRSDDDRGDDDRGDDGGGDDPADDDDLISPAS